MQYNGPLPQFTTETKPFFDGLKSRRLMIRRCRVCEQAFFHPKASCPRCSSSDTEWFQVSGRGTVYSFVIGHRSPPGLEPPSVIAVIELDEGPLMMSKLTGIDSDKVRCGISVEAVYDDLSDDVTLPKFRPANSNEAIEAVSNGH